MGEVSWPEPNVDEDLDRIVNDIQYEMMMAALLGNGGLVGSPLDDPLVYADSTGRQIKALPHRMGVVRGHPWRTDGDGLVLPISANPGATRHDLVVLRLDRADWSVRLKVREGSSGSPLPAPVQDFDSDGAGDGLFEFPVADVTVGTGVTNLGAGDVRMVGYYLGPPVMRGNSTDRAPVALGRIFHEVDTKRTFASDGYVWRLIADLPTVGSVQIKSSTAHSNITSAVFVAGTTNCETTFVAPYSGKVWVKVGGNGGGLTSSRVLVSFEMRLTDVTGAHFQVAIDDNGVMLDAATGTQQEWETLISGLTPGATYYLRTMHRSLGGNTGDLYLRMLGVAPTI